MSVRGVAGRRCDRSKRSSTRSSRRSGAPRKSRRAASCCAPSSARFGKRCWRCRPRNTTGSTFTRAASTRRPAELRTDLQARRRRTKTPSLGVSRARARRIGRQRQFFEFAGPLFSVVDLAGFEHRARRRDARRCKALPRDRSRRRVEDDLHSTGRSWKASGTLERSRDQAVSYVAPARAGPGARQGHRAPARRSSARPRRSITVTAARSLPQIGAASTTERRACPATRSNARPASSGARGSTPERNLIVVNNGHRDFVFASRNKIAEAALPGAPVREGVGAAQFRRLARRPAAGTHGRAVVAHRGEPVCCYP